MPEKNQIIKAEITGMTSEGSGVCHVEGMAVFVPDTAVGDVLNVRIVKVLKSYAYGIVDSIISPSQDRCERRCSVYKKCGGCVYRHISYEAESAIKADIIENAFKRIGGLDPVFDEFIAAEDTDRYRNKAQYPLAEINGEVVCGFYAPRSHRLVPVSDCPLQPEIFSQINETILRFINKKKIAAYSDETHTGIVRHIYIRRGYYSKEIMVCLVVRKDISRQLAPLAEIVCDTFPDVKSFVMNINPEKTNVILGKKCVTLRGDDVIRDTMCGNTVEISPLSFYQVNTHQAEKLYAKALEYAAPTLNDTVADLYCGIGTIGLSIAHSAGRIIGVEIVPEAVENAVKNARINNISNAEYYCGCAEIISDKIKDTPLAVALLDPPRKGCSEEALNAVCSLSPEKIVMLSCDPATAARDAKRLSQHGYNAERVCGADLFPGTRHVETVVLMSRKDK